MRARFFWISVFSLLLLAAVVALSDLYALLHIDRMKAGAAPEDIVGLGFVPVWTTLGVSLCVVFAISRRAVKRRQVVAIWGLFLLLLGVDWIVYVKLLQSMSLL